MKTLEPNLYLVRYKTNWIFFRYLSNKTTKTEFIGDCFEFDIQSKQYLIKFIVCHKIFNKYILTHFIIQYPFNCINFKNKEPMSKRLCLTPILFSPKNLKFSVIYLASSFAFQHNLRQKKLILTTKWTTILFKTWLFEKTTFWKKFPKNSQLYWDQGWPRYQTSGRRGLEFFQGGILLENQGGLRNSQNICRYARPKNSRFRRNLRGR